ncbi:MAG TPA: DNA polymerase III subunit gamma/tau [bacterium]|jgi:DNA polymerase-3 subunit gamma/tau
MSYQVLARRWRPKKFSDVVGQEHVTRTIQNALKQGRLAHAFLFTGPRGVGKTSTARILARAVNCPNIDLTGDAEPCNVCETCRALFEDREMDVIEMDAASYNGVDDIRRINDICRLGPVAGKRKIYIIDEVHMLSKPAFNAFLKTLEEPPEHVIFILATTDVHKVPATILSRVQRFDFRPVQPADVAPYLGKICASEGWAYDEEALWLVARRGEGSLRDAEGLLDQVVSFAGNQVTLEATREVLGILPTELLGQATALIAGHNVAAVPEFLEHLALRGVDYTELLKSLQGYWMDQIFLKEELKLTGKTEEELSAMRQAAANLSIEDLFRLIRLAENLENALRWSTSPRVRFEISFLRWATLDRSVTIRELLDRLDSGADFPMPTPVAATPQSAATRGPTIQLPSTPAPKPPMEAPVKSVSTPPPAPPPPAPEAEPEPEAPKVASVPEGDLSLDSLRQMWPDIMKVLRKKDPVAAGVGESSWALDAFDGKKLTLCSKIANSFATEQLKRSFPNLRLAINEVTGRDLMLVAGPPLQQPASEPAVKPTPIADATPPTEGSDLFANVMNRFGGIEIKPGTTREPK